MRGSRRRVAAAAKLERVEDRVVGVRIIAAGEQLLELELEACATHDHLDERDRDHPVNLTPVMLGRIPHATLVEPQRRRRDRRYGRLDQPARIYPRPGTLHPRRLSTPPSAAEAASPNPSRGMAQVLGQCPQPSRKVGARAALQGRPRAVATRTGSLTAAAGPGTR
jgi:hypothetical protein